MKICVKCKELQPIGQYWKDKQKNDGLRPYCKNCERDRYTSKEYYAQRKDPKYVAIKHRHKMKKYGITEEDFIAMENAQNSCCAICDRPENKMNTKLSVDHSHESGNVRGLLCSNCNRGLGFFKDSPELLVKAATYVKNS
jgi:hypothetical protein